jgi:glutathione gamma-glutamylcysteinyltransferase
MEALQMGHLEGYFSLAEQFVSQSDPAYCGLATLSMCLNALNIDPNRLWKGPWRWFAEDMLDCCTPLDVVKKRGITFTEFACLARCNGASVLAWRGDEADPDHFRNSIKEATSQPHLHMVVSYSRKALGQTGAGHYSPIGGYHPGRDLALVLDVARFKYAPHWVPIEILWKSVIENDEDTGRPRGYYQLARSPVHRPPLVCRISSRSAWTKVAHHLSIMSFQGVSSPEEYVTMIVRHMPPEGAMAVAMYTAELQGRLGVPREHAYVMSSFFDEISRTLMSTIVRNILATHTTSPFSTLPYGAEILAVMLLACPAHLFPDMNPSLRSSLAQIRNLDALSGEVRSEIMEIREQMLQVVKSSCSQCDLTISQSGECKMASQNLTNPSKNGSEVTINGSEAKNGSNGSANLTNLNNVDQNLTDNNSKNGSAITINGSEAKNGNNGLAFSDDVNIDKNVETNKESEVMWNYERGNESGIEVVGPKTKQKNLSGVVN